MNYTSTRDSALCTGASTAILTGIAPGGGLFVPQQFPQVDMREFYGLTYPQTAQKVLANLITIVLGLTVAGQMTADKFVQPDTLLILALGLVAFIFDTAGGVFFAKLLNLFLPEGKKIYPMIGAAGISAFPMSGRVVNQMGLAEDNQNFLLMYSISVNVSGQIASVIAGGLILTLMSSCV